MIIANQANGSLLTASAVVVGLATSWFLSFRIGFGSMGLAVVTHSPGPLSFQRRTVAEAQQFVKRKYLLLRVAVYRKISSVLRVAIKEVADRRGIKTSSELATLLSVPRSTGSRLWKGSVDRIDLGTLEKLCDVLKCKPNDLLRYEPDAK